MSPQEQQQGPVSAPPPGKEGADKSKNANMLLQILPRVPLVLRTALLHILRLSPQSKYLDLQTEVVIAVLRSFINPSKPMSVTTQQRATAQVPEIKGRIWVSTYTCPPPPAGQTGLQDAIAKAIDDLRSPEAPPPVYTMADPAPVEAEWTGYRAGAADDARLPQVSQRELYGEMMKEVKTPVTVLYFHGGAYYLLDPATHRPLTSLLAKLTGGRVYSVRYRLAPQHPFPAALMDALMSYLALLYPPEGAFHEPVKPEHIVFAGDSAGGNLAMALLQLLLHLNRTAHAIPWHGSPPRIIPLPAGVAVNSPWLDVTHSSPSSTANAAFDYLPTPAQQRAADATRPACAAWPPPVPADQATAKSARPPRKHLFADDSLLAHPLVSLVMARSWAGAPPVYICTGWELLADEDKFVAQKVWRDGGNGSGARAGIEGKEGDEGREKAVVVFEEYEGMPHCFGMVFPKLKEARRCVAGWSGFIKQVVLGGEGQGEGQQQQQQAGSNDNGNGRKRKRGVESKFLTVRAKSLKEVTIDPEALWKDEEEVVRERVWKRLRESEVPREGFAKL